MLSIRRGNHGPLNKHTKSTYPFEISYSELTLTYLQTIIEMKIEDAINDADKGSKEYKFYAIEKVRLITNKKRPIKDSPFLNSYTNNQLREICKAIMGRRRNQFVPLDISVSLSPEMKCVRTSDTPVDTPKVEPVLPDSTIVGTLGLHFKISFSSLESRLRIPFLSTSSQLPKCTRFPMSLPLPH